MECAGADQLSRVPTRRIFGFKVFKITQAIFREFTVFINMQVGPIIIAIY